MTEEEVINLIHRIINDHNSSGKDIRFICEMIFKELKSNRCIRLPLKEEVDVPMKGRNQKFTVEVDECPF